MAQLQAHPVYMSAERLSGESHQLQNGSYMFPFSITSLSNYRRIFIGWRRSSSTACLFFSLQSINGTFRWTFSEHDTYRPTKVLEVHVRVYVCPIGQFSQIKGDLQYLLTHTISKRISLPIYLQLLCKSGLCFLISLSCLSYFIHVGLAMPCLCRQDWNHWELSDRYLAHGSYNKATKSTSIR